jgi:hypothetical protein
MDVLNMRSDTVIFDLEDQDCSVWGSGSHWTRGPFSGFYHDHVRKGNA